MENPDIVSFISAVSCFSSVGSRRAVGQVVKDCLFSFTITGHYVYEK